MRMAGATDSVQITITNPCGRNWDAILALELAPDQQGFVSTAKTALADWYHGSKQLRPVVFETGGHVVGMACWQPHTFVEQTGWIANVQIDRRMQGQGFGRAAMEAMLRMLREEQGFEAVELAYHVENHRAAALYLSLGFVPVGMTDSGQMVARIVF